MIVLRGALAKCVRRPEGSGLRPMSFCAESRPTESSPAQWLPACAVLPLQYGVPVPGWHFHAWAKSLRLDRNQERCA